MDITNYKGEKMDNQIDKHSKCNKGQYYHLKDRDYFYCNSCNHYVVNMKG